MRISSVFAGALAVHALLPTAWAADTFLRLGESSHGQSGHIAYVLIEGEVRTLQLIKVSGAEPKTVFKRRIDSPASAPILFADAVIVLDAGGKMLKLDYTGKVLFEGTIPGFKGASKGGGRLDATRIYVQN